MKMDSDGVVAGNSNNIATTSSTQGSVTPIGCWSYWNGTGTMKAPNGGTWAILAAGTSRSTITSGLFSAGANLITNTSSSGFAIAYRVQ